MIIGQNIKNNDGDNFNTDLCVIDSSHNDQSFTRLHLLNEESNCQLSNTNIILLY